jgi:hypothetical protein
MRHMVSRISIEGNLGFFYSCFKIWIVDHIGFDEIYRRLKKLFELLPQEKILLRVFHRRYRFELHEEVEIPHSGQCRFLSGGAEKIEPFHSKGFAERCDFFTQIEYLLNHVLRLYQDPLFLQTTCKHPFDRRRRPEARSLSCPV